MGVGFACGLLLKREHLHSACLFQRAGDPNEQRDVLVW